MVNYLAARGVDIQLLTFQAFRRGSDTFLARRVETAEPSRPDTPRGSGSKQENLRELTELARQQGVENLLPHVDSFIAMRMPGYRWPGKTAISYSLADQTEQGKPTLRAYASLW